MATDQDLEAEQRRIENDARDRGVGRLRRRFAASDANTLTPAEQLLSSWIDDYTAAIKQRVDRLWQELGL